jgi:exodeoxyribonuclease V alpha subunit
MSTIGARLGLPSLFSFEEPANAAEAEFRRQLRQLEIGVETFNLDSSVVHVAVEIADMETDLAALPRLAVIALIVASLIALEEGSTRLPITGNESREPMRRILAPLCGETFGKNGVDLIVNEIDRLLASGMAPSVIGRNAGEYKPLLYDAPFLYQQRIRTAELRLAQAIRPRLRAPVPESEKAIAEAIADISSRPVLLPSAEVALSEEQCLAVANAASHNLALISGGPGTGKTSIILAIFRVLVRLGIDPGEIALAAPTGRAAFRMGDSVRQGIGMVRNRAPADELIAVQSPEASTVHRLLRYSPSPGTFSHHANNPLPAAIVIVDESSMLDLRLTERLMGSLRQNARLIMLGDADQLPSVASGTVFRDIARVAEECSGTCTRLTRNYRTASVAHGQAILALTQRINDGSIDDPQGKPLFTERARAEEFHFDQVEVANGSGAEFDRFLDRWYDARIGFDQANFLKEKIYLENEQGFEADAIVDLQAIFRDSVSSRILCATRVMANGADTINSAIHRRALRDAKHSRESGGFLPGEPVMIVRNDYNRMLFNGDQGVVIRVGSRGGGRTLKAVFAHNGNYVALNLAAIRDCLELCYATTVHKAQGSEFDSVAIVLPDKDLPILTRELFYTAVSRARRSVAIFGNIDLLRAAVARKSIRYSGLGDLLSAPAG